MGSKGPAYDIREIALSDVVDLCERYHGYGGAGGTATYAFGVFEEGRVVAGYAWQPPAYGASKSACPEEPGGVLALSRMVAVPREERSLRHISKPLRHQMLRLIDRGRWPVLLTYSDEGQGHTGHVYKCSGWQKGPRSKAAVWIDPKTGQRRSPFSSGQRRTDLVRDGSTYIQRWEHRVCPEGEAADWMRGHGWCREPIPGKVWKSGNQAHRWVRRSALSARLRAIL